MVFSERLITLRKSKGLSQEALAEAVGVSRQAVSKWETDEAKPDAEKMVALCKALDVSMDHLYLGKELKPEVPAKPRQEVQTPSTGKTAVLVVVACTVIALLIGLVAGFLIPSRTAQKTDHAAILSRISVAYVKPPQTEHNACMLQILLSSTPEGLEASVLVEDTSGATAPQTIPCSLSGNYYTASVPLTRNARYNATLVLTLGDSTAWIPILQELYADGSGYGWMPVWNQTADPAPTPDNAAVLKDIIIVNGDIDRKEQGAYEVRILLNDRPENMTVSFMVEKSGDPVSVATIPCAMSGYYHVASVPLAMEDTYQVSAVITLGESTKRIPVFSDLKVDADGHFSYRPAWENGPEEPPETAPSAPPFEIPAGMSLSDSGGVVQTYPLDESYGEFSNGLGIAVMGEDIVLFAHTEGGTRISVLSGDQLALREARSIGCYLYPEWGDVRVNENGICYYDEEDHAVVYLDTNLNEQRRIPVNTPFPGYHILSNDCATIFYTSEDSLFGWDIETGVSRLIRQFPKPLAHYDVPRVLDDSMILFVHYADQAMHSLFVSLDTGEELFTTDHNLHDVQVIGDFYMASTPEKVILGKMGKPAMLLNTGEETYRVFPADDCEKVIVYMGHGSERRFSCYDLITGKQTATVYTEDSVIAFAGQNGAVWFLLRGDGITLCRWDLSAGNVSDPANYISVP